MKKAMISIIKSKGPSLMFFAVGVIVGYFISLAFEPMMKFVLYRSLLDFIAPALVFLSLVMVIVLIQFRSFYFPRERALKLFFLGVSATSFVLVGCSIVTFPQSLYAGGRAWITFGKDVAYSLGAQYAIRLSDIIYFIGKTLWSTFIGSLFAVLDRYFTL